jgi:hypothetical protein
VLESNIVWYFGEFLVLIGVEMWMDWLQWCLRMSVILPHCQGFPDGCDFLELGQTALSHCSLIVKGIHSGMCVL